MRLSLSRSVPNPVPSFRRGLGCRARRSSLSRGASTPSAGAPRTKARLQPATSPSLPELPLRALRAVRHSLADVGEVDVPGLTAPRRSPALSAVRSSAAVSGSGTNRGSSLTGPFLAQTPATCSIAQVAARDRAVATRRCRTPLAGPRWELELTEKGTGSVPFSDTSSDRCQRTLSVLLGAAR